MKATMASTLTALAGQEVTVRFASGSLTGRLVSVEKQPWGYMLRVSSAIGEHFVAYPGQVLHMVANKAP